MINLVINRLMKRSNIKSNSAKSKKQKMTTKTGRVSVIDQKDGEVEEINLSKNVEVRVRHNVRGDGLVMC